MAIGISLAIPFKKPFPWSYWARRFPSGLTATAISDTQIDLIWVNNGIVDYDYISIERSDDNGINYTEIITVAIGEIIYSNTGLTQASLYYYRIRYRKGTHYSVYSNIAFAESLYDSYTVLYSKFDGADSAITYTDPIAGAASFLATAQLDTAQKRIGSASLLLNGSTDYITYPDSDNYSFGNDPFTIDFWIRFNNATGDKYFTAQRNNGVNYWGFSYSSSNNRLTLYTINTWPTVAIWIYGIFNNSLISPEIGKWYHIVLSRVNSDNAATGWRMFVNGIRINLYLGGGAWNNAMPNVASVLYIGGNGSGTDYVNGWIDKFRISKGIARWINSFNPAMDSYFTELLNYGRKGIVLAPVSPSTKIEEGVVLYDEGIFKMWYTEGGWGIDIKHINYATSTDGIIWTKYAGNPIINAKGRVSIFKEVGIYYLITSKTIPLADDYSTELGFDLYISIDGINFTLDTEDILQVGGVGTWDHTALFNRVVWIEGGTWYMLYEGYGSVGGDTPAINCRMGLATSADGRTWTKHAGNPVINIPIGVGHPWIKKIGLYYYLWAHNEILPLDIYRFRSLDLITWEKYPSNLIFGRKGADEGENPTNGIIADPCLVEYNSKIYMYYCGHAGSLPANISNVKLAITNITINQLILTNENGF